ncbi:MULTISPECIES: oligosaccharide flippase family protein [Bacillus cereus group]|uniref:oligosaccharide flippase family protein n=1 Tax=Bacillus cereus group TaxID=86661 RepID=UPI0018F34DD6|nr:MULTISPECIES: oligosaccharide flippase family protein [Bacillus cereus group]MBJ8095540.1 polysaccharide biosynthesis protein [Bacillus cereus]MCQ6360001.1 oligosaccharide flippase family protein [Bacillus cereus]CAH2464462.1 hypothetical protein ACOSJ1_EBGNOMHC_04996 [Bacillus mycoides KBAB4]
MSNFLRKIKGNRDFKNIFFSFLSYLLIPILTFISVPIMLNNLGITRYGEWIFLNTIVAILLILNLGLGNTIIKNGADYIIHKNSKKFNDIISNAFTVILTIGGILVSLMFFRGERVIAFLSKEDGVNTIDSKVVVILSMWIVFKLITVLFNSVIMTFERYDIVNVLNIIFNALQIIGLAMITFFVDQLFTLCFVAMIIAFFTMVATIILAKRIYPLLNVRLNIDSNVLKGMFNYSLYSWMQSIISTLYSQADRLIVNAFLGTNALAIYSACMQLAIKIHEVPAAVTSFLFPKFSLLHQKNDSESLRKVYFYASYAVTAVVVFIGAVVYIFSTDILTIWLGRGFASNDAVLINLTFSIISGTLFIIPTYFLNGIGKIRISTFVNGFITIANIVFTVLLVPYFGLLGVGYGRFIALPLLIICLVYIERKYLKYNVFLKYFIPFFSLQIVLFFFMKKSSLIVESLIVNFILQITIIIICIVMDVVMFILLRKKVI